MMAKQKPKITRNRCSRCKILAFNKDFSPDSYPSPSMREILTSSNLPVEKRMGFQANDWRIDSRMKKSAQTWTTPYHIFKPPCATIFKTINRTKTFYATHVLTNSSYFDIRALIFHGLQKVPVYSG